ncbi:MAG: hypothetical protein O2854_09620, partial [Chloroflexi bacterium]|nr:hypothetical protein [Chloroflexota bacterium]
EGSIICRATDHTEPTYPLRIGGRLHAISLIELGAQASAAHASLYGFAGHHHAGLLIALNNVEIRRHNSELFDTPLTVRAKRLHFDSGSARYCFAVCSNIDEFLSGEAMFMMKAAKG